MCVYSRGANPFLETNTHTMEKNRYTGDVAYYATMMALSTAMKSAAIMLAKPNPLIGKSIDMLLIGKSIDMLQEIVVSSVPADVRTRLSSPEFALLMQNFIAGCGLNTMTVLQLVKKFENECAANKHCC